MPTDTPRKDVLYPPVGMAHLTAQVPDLVQDRMQGKSGLEISCSMQPKSSPHLGSAVTLMTAFAIAQRFSETFRVPARITFDVLENAPAESINIDGLEYTRSLADVQVDGKRRSDLFVEPVVDILRYLSSRSGIPHRVRTYTELQAHRTFRTGLIEIIRRSGEFAPILSPSERRLRVRFPCPTCKYAEKRGVMVRVVEVRGDSVQLSSSCPTHGAYERIVSTMNADFVDANAPIRSILKACVMIEECRQNNCLPIIVNGGDWAGMWVQRIYCEAMTGLGIQFADIPLYMFSPVILDWSGAKLSKTLYLRPGAYDYLPEAYVDFAAFKKSFGEKGVLALWEEVQSWIAEPAKYFRDYSVEYLRQIIEGGE